MDVKDAITILRGDGGIASVALYDEAKRRGAQALEAWAWVERTGHAPEGHGRDWQAYGANGYGEGHTPLAAVLDAMEKEVEDMKHIKDLANPAVDRVLIYAGDGGCYWRENGCGYTNAQNAGVFTRAEAISLAGHCGPEKRVELHDVPEDHLPTLKARIAALEAELAEARRDDAELDATDAAKPSWWRGNEYGVAQICHAVNEILDGKEISGVCGEPWESTRRRLAEARKDWERWAFVRKHADYFHVGVRGKKKKRYVVQVAFMNYEYDLYPTIDEAMDATMRGTGHTPLAAVMDAMEKDGKGNG